MGTLHAGLNRVLLAASLSLVSLPADRKAGEALPVLV
jgi:hypothetical protein